MSRKYFSDKTHVAGQNWFQFKTVGDFSPDHLLTVLPTGSDSEHPIWSRDFLSFLERQDNVLSLKKITNACRRTFLHGKSRRSLFNDDNLSWREIFQQSPGRVQAVLEHFNCRYCLSQKGRKVTHQTGHLEWLHELSKNSDVNDLFSGRGGVLTVW